MADLEAKNRTTSLQLAVLLVTAMVGGIPGSTVGHLLEAAGHATWLALIGGATLFYGVAWLMIKLGQFFPDDSFAEYMPRILGRWPGGAVVWLLVLVFLVQEASVLQAVSREITFFMFDRTPIEVVEIALLAVCVYAALQEWGTILRVVQVIFSTAFPLWLLFLLVALLGFRLPNLMPLWPESATGVIAGALHSWEYFQGYEWVLLIFPLIARGDVRPAKATAWAFLMVVAVFLLIAALIIGSLTLEGARNTPYSLLTVVRNVEVPGTFLERLDTYFLVLWVQIVFAHLTLAIYFMAQNLTLLYRYADHRPLVLAVAPLLFLLATASHHARVQEVARGLGEWSGLAFSLAVIPLIYAFVWWRRRRHEQGQSAGG